MAKLLKVLAVGDPAVEAYACEKYGIISGYESLTGVKVAFDIASWDKYYSTMMEAFEGKESYDIVMVAGHLWSADFVSKGYISEVDYSLSPDFDTPDILPVIMDEMKVGGKPYLYPSFCDGHMILYRKSIVEKLVGHLPGEVITADELIELVKAVDGYNGLSGIVIKAAQSEIFLDALPYIRSEGVKIFDPQTHRPDFNNEKGIAGLEKYLSLRKYAPQDTCNYGNEEVCEAIRSKKTVFAVTWGGQLGQVMNDKCIEPEDIGFSTFDTAWNVTWSFAINKGTELREEANRLLAYLSGKQTDRIVGEYAGAPVRRSSYEADKNRFTWYPVLYSMISNCAEMLPKMENAGSKMGHLYETISQAFTNKITAAEAIDKAEKSILQE